MKNFKERSNLHGKEQLGYVILTEELIQVTNEVYYV